MFLTKGGLYNVGFEKIYTAGACNNYVSTYDFFRTCKKAYPISSHARFNQYKNDLPIILDFMDVNVLYRTLMSLHDMSTLGRLL